MSGEVTRRCDECSQLYFVPGYEIELEDHIDNSVMGDPPSYLIQMKKMMVCRTCFENAERRSRA